MIPRKLFPLERVPCHDNPQNYGIFTGKKNEKNEVLVKFLQTEEIRYVPSDHRFTWVICEKEIGDLDIPIKYCPLCKNYTMQFLNCKISRCHACPALHFDHKAKTCCSLSMFHMYQRKCKNCDNLLWYYKNKKDELIVSKVKKHRQEMIKRRNEIRRRNDEAIKGAKNLLDLSKSKGPPTKKCKYTIHDLIRGC